MAIVLTHRGINLLEKKVIEAFVKEDPNEIQKAAQVFDLNLTDLLKKYLKKYLEIEEDLLRIRSGMEPKYNPPEYYTPQLKSREYTLAD